MAGYGAKEIAFNNSTITNPGADGIDIVFSAMRSDNGSEFIVRILQRWLAEHKVIPFRYTKRTDEF